MARKFPLYASYTINGWRQIRHIAYDLGEAMVHVGAACKLFDDFEQFVGYQLVDSETYDTKLPSRNSSAALTATECEANAGLYGVSATARMSEDKRMARFNSQTGKHLPAEDFVELARAKVFAQTHSANVAKDADGRAGDRAPRVYPKAAPWDSVS